MIADWRLPIADLKKRGHVASGITVYRLRSFN